VIEDPCPLGGRTGKTDGNLLQLHIDLFTFRRKDSTIFERERENIVCANGWLESQDCYIITAVVDLFF
jgi:hypothetical protein